MVARLMDEGRLPNLKRCKEMGTTTNDMSMLGVHPTITPPNWASLATGANPGTHGITCYWNHVSGEDLFKLRHGFNSELCKSQFIWDVAAQQGKKSIIFNYPTSWPPTSKDNTIVVDGTGINVNARAIIDHERMYYCKAGEFPIEEFPYDADATGADCVAVSEDGMQKDFNVAELGPGGRTVRSLLDKRVETNTKKIDVASTPIRPARGWSFDTVNDKEVVLPINSGQQRRYGLIKTSDGKAYDTLEIYANKQANAPLGTVKTGAWADWIHDSFKFEGKDVPVAYKLKLIALADDASEMTIYYNAPINVADNKWFYPSHIGQELFQNVGPMANQSYCMDHDLMIEVMEMNYAFYAKAILYLTKTYGADILYLHVHCLDAANHMFQSKISEDSGPDYKRYQEWLFKYYEITDRFVGKMTTLLDGDTAMFLVSDHGGISRDVDCETPLLGDPWNIGGKALEDLGYLVVNREGPKAEVDWKKTKAIGQRSGYIYINLKGREPQGSVDPSEYDALVEHIIDDLYCYRDGNGRRPIGLALRKEDMPVLGLYGDTVGDIYFLFNPPWARVHGTSLTTHANKGTSVRCLFMATGAGIKEGVTIDRRVKIIDIVPTICQLIGLSVPKDCEGGIIYQALN